MKQRALLLLAFVLILTGCDITGKGEPVVITEESIIDKRAVEYPEGADDFLTGQAAVRDMGIGWNLGNSLDSCNFKRYTQEEYVLQKAEYQIMAIYEDAVWSDWVASDAIYFDSDGTVHLEWEINNEDSSLQGDCGKFAFQIINNKITDINDQPIKILVKEASFLTKDGTLIALNDMLGEFELPLEKGVSKFIAQDITNNKKLQKEADVVGGKLSLLVNIKQYPVPVTKNKEVSVNNYYETLWGNPITTKEMIESVAKAGFKSVRVPITYYDHINNQGVISELWLSRIKEIVDFVLEEDMYCIINIHHDTGEGSWIKADLNNIELQKQYLASLWMQIGTYFKDYDEKLLFEGFNEILDQENRWKNAGEDSYKAVNVLNQQFVDTVRSTGGNNLKRNLIIKTYAASSSEDVLQAFKIPTDNVKKHLIGGVHYYSELEYDPDKMLNMFTRLENSFLIKGIPVVIGEFASKNNWSEEDSISYIKRFMNKVDSNYIAVFWWDRGGTKETELEQTETLFDRSNLSWYSEDLLKAVLSKEN